MPLTDNYTLPIALFPAPSIMQKKAVEWSLGTRLCSYSLLQLLQELLCLFHGRVEVAFSSREKSLSTRHKTEVRSQCADQPRPFLLYVCWEWDLPVHGSMSVECLKVPQVLLRHIKVLLHESCLEGQLLHALAEDLRMEEISNSN